MTKYESFNRQERSESKTQRKYDGVTKKNSEDKEKVREEE